MSTNTTIRWQPLKAAVSLCFMSLGLAACSNDVDLPSSFHQDRLDQPTGVVAVVDDGAVTVTWELASAANAVGFVVRFTDADGVEETRFAKGGATRTLADDTLALAAGTLYLVDVWAVDDADFFGPASAADTLVVE